MNKKLIIILAAVLGVVLIGAVAVYLVTSPSEDEEDIVAEEDYIEIQPEDVGFSYELREDGTGITLTFANLDGVETLEYDLSYTKEIEGKDGTVEAPGGVPGEFDVSGRSSYEVDIDFGTCSSGRCVFDKIVSPELTLIVRVGYENGEVGIFEEQIPFEQE